MYVNADLRPALLSMQPKVSIQFSQILSAAECVEQIRRINGAVDIYTWFEGPQGIPKKGANFLKERLFDPLYACKQDLTLYLYSLKGWDFPKVMESASALGDAINRVNSQAVKCLYAYLFFSYLKDERAVQSYFDDTLKNKRWLLELSADRKETGQKVSDVFKKSLLDSVRELDLTHAYSMMQYIEGYYLIQRSIRQALIEKKDKISIVFLLPNDEQKYYRDFPQEIEKILFLDFKNETSSIAINIGFFFYQYGTSPADRPYIDKTRHAEKMTPLEMDLYLKNFTVQVPK